MPAARGQKAGQRAIAAADFQRKPEWPLTDGGKSHVVFFSLIGAAAMMPGIVAGGIEPGQVVEDILTGQ